MHNKARKPYLGAAAGAAAGFIFGNFIFSSQSVQLAEALSDRFGSTWFFTDLLAQSFSPVGALAGLVIGFILIDLPYIALRQIQHDNLSAALVKVRKDPQLQQQIFTLWGYAAAAAPLTLAHREVFWQILTRIGLPLGGTVEQYCETALRRGAKLLEPPAEAAAALAPLGPPFARWLCARILDAALCDLEMNSAEEQRFLAVGKLLGIPAVDSASLVQLRLSAAAEYRPSRHAVLSAAAPWDRGDASSLQDGSEEPESSAGDYIYAAFNEAAAFNAAVQAQAQGRDLTLAEAYLVLGLPFGAPAGAVKKRARRLIFIYHPDHQAQKGAAERERAAFLTVQLQSALAVIMEALGVKV